MTNPFDVQESAFLVLANAEGQQCLWPASTEVPSGWNAVYGPDARQACLRYVDTNWTDMRPGGAPESTPSPFEGMSVDHVEFYVSDVAGVSESLVGGYGFAVHARSDWSATDAHTRSVGLGRNQIRLVLTEPRVDDHPATAYIGKHGDGVANIAIRVPDTRAAFAEAVRRGARPVSGPAVHGDLVLATIGGFGDVVHTFVQRPAGADERALPGLSPVSEAPDWDAGLFAMDHFAVCVEAGQLDPMVSYYEQILDFDMTFTEYIVVGEQAMNSKVVQNKSRTITLTLIEPDLSRASGQIDEFLKNHGGAGVQHIAFNTDDIVRAVGAIRDHGVEFLSTPDAYYSLLGERLQPAKHSLEALHGLNILVDQDHLGQLFQIFARSVHPRKTLFFEVIERLGAQTFGSGNIRALYEAVELQRHKDAANP